MKNIDAAPVKQPPGLTVLFLTEMWERFGFYIVQGLLILYMTKVFGFSDNKGYTILGAFTALAYIAPIVGGFIADHVLGFRATIILGNVLLIIGYALLVFHGKPLLYFSLAVIVTGIGLLKPNISSVLGALYERNDSRREAGFTLFYIGLNLGILLATVVAGFVQQKIGWHASFAMASLGLIVGLITFVSGARVFGKHGLAPKTIHLDIGLVKFLSHKGGLVIGILVFLGAVWALISYNKAANFLLWISSVILFAGLIYAATRYPKVERNKFLALIILTLISTVYWSMLFQAYFSVNLFVDRDVNRHWFGVEIPAVMFIGLEAFFIIVLGPLFASFWQKLSQRNKNWSIPFKFALGTLAGGLAFFWVILGIYTSNASGNASGLINPLWIVLVYLFLTIGELLISPVGLSMVTVLSPPKLVGMMMGVWLIALGFGGKLAGIIAKFSSIPKGVTNPRMESFYYLHAFTFYVIYGAIAGVVILLLVPMLRKLERGENPW